MAWPRKRVLFPTMVFAVVLVGFLAFWYSLRPDSINHENFKKITLGTSREQVEKILGYPPTHAPGESASHRAGFPDGVGNYRPEYGPFDGPFAKSIEEKGLAWVGKKGIIYLAFDEHGVVTGRLLRYNSFDHGNLDWLRLWL